MTTVHKVSAGRKVFFTSDLHFHHKRILEAQAHTRSEASLSEMQAKVIDAWNSVVSPGDLVFNLGDFSFRHSASAIQELTSALHGEHHLILGNHDHGLKQTARACFASVQDVATVRVDGEQFFLSHYPHLAWPRHHVHLHGHMHGTLPQHSDRFDVGVDAAPEREYTPWGLSELMNELSRRNPTPKETPR